MPAEGALRRHGPTARCADGDAPGASGLAGGSSSVWRSTTTPPNARQASQGAGLNALTGPDLTALLDQAGFTETDNAFIRGSIRCTHATMPSDHPSTPPSARHTPARPDRRHSRPQHRGAYSVGAFPRQRSRKSSRVTSPVCVLTIN